ncbi:hypothetical protein ACIQFZ_37820 [Streptomyces sp. NPDC093064]|uniref:hypothetical protein n=1 Tax=unclassified Streptomyces TaxID=2593676 RepID=UPI0034491F20
MIAPGGCVARRLPHDRPDKTWAGEEVKLSHTEQQLCENDEKMVIQAFTTGRFARGPTVNDVD